jgi:sensor histidine kinase regulating citrate/malate metabolism
MTSVPATARYGSSARWSTRRWLIWEICFPLFQLLLQVFFLPISLFRWIVMRTSTIASLEHSVKEQAKLEEMAAAEKLAADMSVNGGIANLLPSYQAMVAKTAKATPAQLNKVTNDKWAKYTHDRTGKPRFDQAGSQAWLKDYNTKLQKVDSEHIAPHAGPFCY